MVPMTSARWTLALSVVAGGVLLWATLASGPVRAQNCNRPLCHSGETYTGGGSDRLGLYGICQGQSDLGFLSHYLARCPAGSTLNVDTGHCVLDACIGGGSCGGLAPLCDSAERYSPGADDSDGVGICSFGGVFLPITRAHRTATCREGWTLQEATGLCQRDCLFVTEIDTELLFPTQLPDLTIRRTWLRSTSGVPVAAVPHGSPYQACFEVANGGGVASGPFHVGGGGLGVPTPPSQAHATLAVGTSRQACLFYPGTPQPGSYVVFLKADSFDVVDESREDNNTADLNVVVEP